MSISKIELSNWKCIKKYNALELDSFLEKLTLDIVNAHSIDKKILLIGIHQRGVPLAQRLQKKLNQKGYTTDIGSVDMTLHRDDIQQLSIAPKIYGTELPFDLEDQTVILCDEVLYTGRTVRAAMDEILEYGRPKLIQLAVLIDRPGRELPIQPNFSSIQITEKINWVHVQFKETDSIDQIEIY
jgi:pyrimidine operon attenuation protein/uracil phosphoribosyltransferase